MPIVVGVLTSALIPSDGGGIRGLSELLILKEIMERIQFEEKRDRMPLPCEYFEMIGGTSTGGYVAVVLWTLLIMTDVRRLSSPLMID